MARSREEWVSNILSGIGSGVILTYNFACLFIPPARKPRRTVPIIEAVKRGDAEKVRQLLAQGADPNARETQAPIRYGLWMRLIDVPEPLAKTALILAAGADRRDIVKILLDNGADVNATASWGETALTCAVGRQSDLEIAKLLIARGADVNRWGFEPPLTVAACEERVDLVRLLLDNGADVNAIDEAGYTALMEPAELGYSEIVNTLIAAGIDVNAREREGRTALSFARERHQTAVADILVRVGARG